MLTHLPLPEADILIDPSFLTTVRADALFARLRDEIALETHRIKLFGREIDSPRRSCWIGDTGASYIYSNTRFEPRPWSPALAALREAIAIAAGERFNSVLANLYRDGRDSMGWHCDDEPELGPSPVIASLSLGATRRFSLKQKRAGAKPIVLDLPSGSLLLMRGQTQKNYRHALPKTTKPVAERINLTFRRIFNANGQIDSYGSG
jgi:alkylated DNA repair dioxygenase AlkB